MTTKIREERVQELCESAYIMLKDSHNALHELKGLVDRLHDGYLKEESGENFDTVSAIKVTTDRVYADLERYLRPELDPDSAYDDAMTETP